MIGGIGYFAKFDRKFKCIYKVLEGEVPLEMMLVEMAFIDSPERGGVSCPRGGRISRSARFAIRICSSIFSVSVVKGLYRSYRVSWLIPIVGSLG
jgi:hypothetical protein